MDLDRETTRHRDVGSDLIIKDEPVSPGVGTSTQIPVYTDNTDTESKRRVLEHTPEQSSSTQDSESAGPSKRAPLPILGKIELTTVLDV